jgi:hypothetical protein
MLCQRLHLLLKYLNDSKISRNPANVIFCRALRSTMHITLPMLLHPQVDIADVIDAGRILLVGGRLSRLDLCVVSHHLHSPWVFYIFCMSPLEHSAQHAQQCLAVAATNIATDQNQLIAAVCGARTHLQASAKKLQDTQTAYAKVASAASSAPNINIHDCASAARTQRDDIMALAGQMLELAQFLKVLFAFTLPFQPSFSSKFRLNRCVTCSMIAAAQLVSDQLIQEATAHNSSFPEVPTFPFAAAAVASQLKLNPKTLSQ